MTKILLIDADPIKYAAACSIEKWDKELEMYIVEPKHHAFYNVNSIVKRILKKFEDCDHKFFLTAMGDRSNFRFSVYQSYKANRLKMHKPTYLEDVHNFIKRKYNAHESVGEEADDRISIEQCNNDDTIICSIDKDFNNVPGWHYNPKKDITYYVTEIEALRNFYLQILTGDVCDNIPRIKKGWLKKKVENKILATDTEEELLQIVLKEIVGTLEVTEDAAIDYVNQMGRCLWLRREEKEMWAIKGPLCSI